MRPLKIGEDTWQFSIGSHGVGIQEPNKGKRHNVHMADFMLAVMRDETADFKDRFEAAKGAAPYVHPRLAAVEHSGNDDKPLGFMIVSSVPRQGDEYLNGHANGRPQDH